MTKRSDNRLADQLRELNFVPNFVPYAEGSILISMGNTRVLCNVTINEEKPRWMKEQDIPGGWITGEYAMLPRSTQQRTSRETLRPKGRSQEIQRLVGRSLRAGFDLKELGERTFIVDCDVIQADGGTRTAAINGGYLALRIAIEKLVQANQIPKTAILPPVGAISLGIVKGIPMLDLCYSEDVSADADVNIVMNSNFQLIEIQGTAEKQPFNKVELNSLLSLAEKGISEIFEAEKEILPNML